MAHKMLKRGVILADREKIPPALGIATPRELLVFVLQIKNPNIHPKKTGNIYTK